MQAGDGGRLEDDGERGMGKGGWRGGRGRGGGQAERRQDRTGQGRHCRVAGRLLLRANFLPSSCSLSFAKSALSLQSTPPSPPSHLRGTSMAGFKHYTRKEHTLFAIDIIYIYIYIYR